MAWEVAQAGIHRRGRDVAGTGPGGVPLDEWLGNGPQNDVRPSSMPALGFTTASGSVVRDSNPEVESHERIHRMHFANGAAGRPTASHGDLERDARAGARALLHGFDYATSLAASPGMALAYEPGEFAGPCEIVTDQLTNRGLIQELGRARYHVSQGVGSDAFYDWANLLRRLEATRQRRIESGHVWLATPSLRDVPAELYFIDGEEPGYVTVRRAVPADVADSTSGGGRIYVTVDQFERFVERNRVPRHSIAAIVSGQLDDAVSVPIPFDTTRARRLEVLPSTSFDGPLGQVVDFYEHWHPPFDPFGDNLGGQGITMTSTTRGESSVSRLTDHPQWFTASGRELMFRPARGPMEPEPLLDIDHNPSQVLAPGALGFLAAPPIGLPEGSTGVLWGAGHVVDFVVVQGRMVTGGFRAGLWRHGLSDVERVLGSQNILYRRGEGAATASLNQGRPGSYANDALFPLSPDSVVVYRTDGNPATAEEVLILMAEARHTLSGEIYRYSPPDPDHPAYERAFGQEGPEFCPPGAQNCINLPMEIHERALGGDHMVLAREDGAVIRLGDASHASAKNMRAWTDTASESWFAESGLQRLPDSWFEERGLTRRPISGQAWRGVGAGAGLGGGVSLATDLYADLTSDAQPAYIANMAVNSSVGGAGVILESYVSNGAMRLVQAGVPAGASVGLGRAIGGAGVGVVAAPLVTGATMYFDDSDYSTIDYAASMTRSGVANGGGVLAGALAMGGFFALGGSEVPALGNAIGFVVGFGGSLATDWLVGDATEVSIRARMGEGGCVDGVAPPH